MVKALRLSEEQYSAVLKRNAKALATWSPTPGANKFHAKPVDGFDSTFEAKRFRELELEQRAGAISELRRQVPFLLIDAQRAPNGKLIERACRYKADFVYRRNGELVVEDCKGMKSGTAYAVFVIKRKLLLLRHGIRVHELSRGS